MLSVADADALLLLLAGECRECGFAAAARLPSRHAGHNSAIRFDAATLSISPQRCCCHFAADVSC